MTVLPSFPGFGSFAEFQLGDHLCLPVGSDAERLGGTAECADLGLRRGGKVLVFTDTETPDEMTGYLRSRSPRAAAGLASGQLEVISCQDVHLAGGCFSGRRTRAAFAGQLTRAEQQGYPGLWIVVDMAWGLSGLPGTETMISHEVAVNEMFVDGRLAAACIYDRSRFCPMLVEAACYAHPLTPGQAPLRFVRTSDPPGLALSGEADLTNHEALAALLSSLRTAPGHLTLDAAALWFADLRAAKLLSDLRAVRGQGRTTIVGSDEVNRLLRAAGNRLTGHTRATRARGFDG